MLEVATPLPLWSRDHWSMLAYIETCAVDKSSGGTPGAAQLDYERMRVNPAVHPLCAWASRGDRRWEPDYGTRLADGKQLAAHDDIDVLDDLASLQLIEILGLGAGLVLITGYGIAVAAQIRAFKVAGGKLSAFKMADPRPGAPSAAIMGGPGTNEPTAATGAEDPTVSLTPPRGTFWLVSQKGARVAHLAEDGPGIKQPLCGRFLVLATPCEAPKVKRCQACVAAHKRRSQERAELGAVMPPDLTP